MLCHNLNLAIFVQVFGGRSWSLSGMLKDRGHKGSWKGGGSNNQRTKKKSYGNIHSINDRGIHEIQGRDFLRRLSNYIPVNLAP